MEVVNRLLLSIASAETLNSVGLYLIIVGLVAEAVVVFFVPSGRSEKLLSISFTLVIALGVWVEHVGTEALSAPRTLRDGQQAVIIAKLRTFNGQEFGGASPPEFQMDARSGTHSTVH